MPREWTARMPKGLDSLGPTRGDNPMVGTPEVTPELAHQVDVGDTSLTYGWNKIQERGEDHSHTILCAYNRGT